MGCVSSRPVKASQSSKASRKPPKPTLHLRSNVPRFEVIGVPDNSVLQSIHNFPPAPTYATKQAHGTLAGKPLQAHVYMSEPNKAQREMAAKMQQQQEKTRKAKLKKHKEEDRFWQNQCQTGDASWTVQAGKLGVSLPKADAPPNLGPSKPRAPKPTSQKPSISKAGAPKSKDQPSWQAGPALTRPLVQTSTQKKQNFKGKEEKYQYSLFPKPHKSEMPLPPKRSQPPKLQHQPKFRSKKTDILWQRGWQPDLPPQPGPPPVRPLPALPKKSAKVKGKEKEKAPLVFPPFPAAKASRPKPKYPNGETTLWQMDDQSHLPPRPGPPPAGPLPPPPVLAHLGQGSATCRKPPRPRQHGPGGSLPLKAETKGKEKHTFSVSPVSPLSPVSKGRNWFHGLVSPLGPKPELPMMKRKERNMWPSLNTIGGYTTEQRTRMR